MTRLEFNNYIFQLSRKLYLVAYRFLRNREEAQDAVQEVFIKLWNKKDKLDEYTSIEAFAITTTKNYCIDQLRKIKTIGLEDSNHNLPFFFNEPSPYEQLERDETSKILHIIIDGLPLIYKDIVRQREIEGLGYEEIAKNTKQNINTLRVNLSRARSMIRDELKKYNYENQGNRQVAGKIL
jgi:RNA polymerase sigma factor (sigma-70 family)